MQLLIDKGSPTPVLKDLGAEDRRRLSGPGLRTIRGISDAWKLTEGNRRAMLGHPPRSTYHSWMKKAADGEAISLPFDTLVRISAILGIHKSLEILFHDRNQAMIWLKGPHSGTVFSGASPLQFILDGGQDGMMTVRRYLDGWRGGEVGQGALKSGFEPVTEKDIVFL